jgi:hypothetical protein
MGWIVETVIDLIVTDLIGAAYKRYGFWGAAMAILGPIVLIGLLIAILFSV